jgi:hypothetical protein
MNLILDTHFLLWVALDIPRLDEFDWLDRYRPWGVSPVSFLEVAFLSEVGRVEVDRGRFMDAVGRDPPLRGGRGAPVCPDRACRGDGLDPGSLRPAPRSP